MREDRFTIPGLEGRFVMFVSSISAAAACLAEVCAYKVCDFELI
jgi:hypothetical protein